LGEIYWHVYIEDGTSSWEIYYKEQQRVFG